MPASVESAMPLVILLDNYSFKLEALSPTDGSDVTGVTVSNAILMGEVEGDIEVDTVTGPFMFVPGPTGAA